MNGVFQVYILQGENSRYIGCSSDVIKRLDAHNKGISVFTKNRGPWKLEWISEEMSHTEALRLEKIMKKQKGGNGLMSLMQQYKLRGS